MWYHGPGVVLYFIASWSLPYFLLSNDSFEFINQIAINHLLWKALLQKSFQANIVFTDQLCVTLVEFRKYFAKLFIISIALFQQLSSQKLVSVVEGTYILSCFIKTN